MKSLAFLALLSIPAIACPPIIIAQQLIEEGVLIELPGGQLGEGANMQEQMALAKAQANGQAPGANQKAKAADPEAFRKDFLSKLKFDRTPAGILKEQSEVRKPQEEEAPLPEEADEKTALQAQYENEAKAFRSNVILGNWAEVQRYLADLPESLAKTTYDKLLTDLGKPVQVTPRPELALMGARPHPQQHFLTVSDVLALSDASPEPPLPEQIGLLAKLLPSNPAPEFFALLEKGTRYLGTSSLASRAATSALLLEARHIKESEVFLPELAEARKEKSHLALNILSRFHAEAFRSNLGKKHLPLAWELSLEVVSDETAETKKRGEALYRALSLVGELEHGSGEEWLKKTFSDPAGEGFDILAAVGTMGAEARVVRSSNFRLQQIKLQSSAAEALLATEGIDLAEWKDIFTIYALNWLNEAQLSERLDRSTSMRPQMQFDNYGNVFYSQRAQTQNNNQKEPNPIPIGDLLDILPSAKWISSVDKTVRLQLLERIPSLFLKVKEERKAFPFIKELAAERPETAKQLVRNLVSVWADNHNPNQSSRYRSSYSYYYGYNNRAETIPLTRSKQERNLEELSELVAEVRALKLEDSFDKEFSSAFITVHSQAEVWRLEALEKVFGDLTTVDADTIASLIERMRINLAALWPDPKLQEEFDTKRTDKEQHQQVLAGYEMARELTASAWGETPESSRLLTQLAALTYEESNYLSAKQPQTTHSTTKRTALDDFAEAAKLYAQTLPLKNERKESTAVYETWFFAALGSPLLEALKNHHQPVQSEFPKIKAALESLPEGAKERHLKRFARALNSRLTNVAPDLKFRYLESALGITGSHEEMATSAEVFDYYQDLVTEIELRATVDGSDQIGREPFGLFVNLHHTQEIERESGGFQRYLQNQNTSTSYSYNFGRPTEDYRDKFEKAARAALEEHFEIITLTFHTDKIESRTSTRPGWRVTPYAYFLLKAKGPQIDSVPPLKIDLDFLDTSGHVVLPVASASLPVDASKATASRPFRDLKVTMTLDERNAAEKVEWHLEVKTTAEGLPPALASLMALPPEGFKVVKTEDRELQIQELTTQSDDGAPLSTHEYRLTLKPDGASPSQFTFPKLTALASNALAADDAVMRQRYLDVDLLPVGETVALNEQTGLARGWFWLIAVIALLAASAAWVWTRLSRKPVEIVEKAGPSLPSRLTPVSLLHWLQQLEGRVEDDRKEKLKSEIEGLQRAAFSKGNSDLELEQIAKAWSQ